MNFLKKIQAFYNPIVVEIHHLEEIEICQKEGIQHVLLDNFTPEMVQEALKFKKRSQMTYEISGGINLENLDKYLVEGIDAISIGALTSDCPRVDLSLKFKR